MSEEAREEVVQDVKQLGLVAAIISLGYVFWVVGAMEMVERLAYYGVRSVSGLYGTDPVSKGGLGLKAAQFGVILSAWSWWQSLVPIAVGGLADRYGYKRMIAISTVVKIAGYLVMAASPTFQGFFLGALLLATGTAIFKPGIQGTLVKATNRQNSSMAWGIFYQTVNIGAAIGPPMAGALRQLAWRNVFLACAAIISLNFILLLTYREPGLEERVAAEKARKAGAGGGSNFLQDLIQLIIDTLREMFKPHVLPFLIIFSGFYFMFYSLFDVVPLHIRDWVNTKPLVTSLFGPEPVTNQFIRKALVMNTEGTTILPEGIANVNAAMIMTTCFLFAFLSSRLRALHSMILGTTIASAALFIIGYTPLAWICVFAIVLFSIGEMLSSPKFSEFVGNIAPGDKKAMYLGLCQVSAAFGSGMEGWLGPSTYGELASREKFAREMLAQNGVDPKAIPEGEGFTKLVELLNQTPEAVTHLLYEAHKGSILKFWALMGTVGLLTAVGIFIYARWMDSRNR